MFADTFIARVLNQHRLASLQKAHEHSASLTKKSKTTPCKLRRMGWLVPENLGEFGFVLPKCERVGLYYLIPAHRGFSNGRPETSFVLFALLCPLTLDKADTRPAAVLVDEFDAGNFERCPNSGVVWNCQRRFVFADFGPSNCRNPDR
jgi:hypothetical protein